jgi:hypothetical protein
MNDSLGAAGGTAAAASVGFALAQALPPALLYRRCDPAELPFAVCSELEEPAGPIGQERAVEALNLALRIRGKGYNVYALGAAGTGRHGIVEDLLRQRAAGEPTPPDWCYVNNFDDPQQPRHLQLPAGRGAALAAAMKRLVEELRAALPAAFERDEYRARREAIEQQFKQQSEEAFGALQRRAESHDIALMRPPIGLALAPTRDGKVLTPELFNGLPPTEREHIQHQIEAIRHDLEATMRDVPQWERAHRDAVQVRKELVAAARRHRATCSFVVVPGGAESAPSSFPASERGLVVAGALTRPVAGHFRMAGRGWSAVAAAAPGSLLLVRQAWSASGAVVLLLRDRGPAAARLLAAAARIAHAADSVLTVIGSPVVAGAAGFQQWIGEQIAGLPVRLQVEIAPPSRMPCTAGSANSTADCWRSKPASPKAAAPIACASSSTILPATC